MNNPQHEPSLHSNKSVFVLVFLMLCALTGLSYWISVSHLMDNRLTGWAAMMAVSSAKAMLVVLFFMHLWWERVWKFALTVPAIIMGTLLVLLLVPDIGLRTDKYSRERIDAAAEDQLSPVVPRHSSNRFSGQSS